MRSLRPWKREPGSKHERLSVQESSYADFMRHVLSDLRPTPLPNFANTQAMLPPGVTVPVQVRLLKMRLCKVPSVLLLQPVFLGLVREEIEPGQRLDHVH